MPDRTCDRTGCEKPIRARGMCSTHYNSWMAEIRAGGVEPPATEKRTKRQGLCRVPNCRGLVAQGATLCRSHGGAVPQRKPVISRRGRQLAWRFVADQIALREHGAECWEDWYWYPSQERPTLRYRGQQMKAARLVRFLIDGSWPEVACHTCDNEKCWNPGHIYAGTHQTNYDDMVARGRAGWQNRR